MRLFQICAQIDDLQRNNLRIRLDGVEFSYGTEEYVRRQNLEITEYSIHPGEMRNQVIVASTKEPRSEEQVKKEKEKSEEIRGRYKPEKPRYKDIGI